MIARNGMVVLEAFFYPYPGKTVHELASVTQSITTTLIAIAADQDRLKLDQPMTGKPATTVSSCASWFF